ncbi:hypothetical protein PAMP_011591 [Pampus punctatissimus]
MHACPAFTTEEKRENVRSEETKRVAQEAVWLHVCSCSSQSEVCVRLSPVLCNYQQRAGPKRKSAGNPDQDRTDKTQQNSSTDLD